MPTWRKERSVGPFGDTGIDFLEGSGQNQEEYGSRIALLRNLKPSKKLPLHM